MAVSIPETFRFDFITPSSTGTFPPIIEACSKMNFSFKTIDIIEESPFSPYYVQFYVQENGKPPYSFLGGSFSSTDKGTLNLPFNNSQMGAQFVTCMYTSNVPTGGCQNVYTVIETSNDCTIDPLPTVGNALTVSMQTPSVTGDLTDLGQYSSWPTVCTDIHFKVDGGPPPYLLTIANACVPPRNYTFQTSSFEWKVDLARGYPFFLSIFDSAGLSFTAGPLHGGGGGSMACLASSQASIGVFAGPAFGGVVVGLIGFLLGLWGIKRWKKKAPKPLFADVDESELASAPFHTVLLDGPLTRHSSRPNAGAAGERDGDRSHESPGAGGETRNDSGTRNVFVLHHDGGGPPVTVFTDGASQVFELPPSYLRRDLPSPSSPQSSCPRTPTFDRPSNRNPKLMDALLPLHSIEPGRSGIPPPSLSPATAVDATESIPSRPSPSSSNRNLPPLPSIDTSPLYSSQITRGRHTISSDGRIGRRWSDSSATTRGY